MPILHVCGGHLAPRQICRAIVKALIDGARKRLRVWGDSIQAKADTWTPVLQEDSGRSLSAPQRWLCGVTDIGRLRTNNEDSYFLSRGGGLWIVADGMGGHAAGEVASALTVESIAAAIDTTHAGGPSAGPAAH